MSVVYANAVKDNRLNVVNDAVNAKTYSAGTGAGSVGSLVIGTSALSGATGVLATVMLRNPAFTEAAQVLTLAGVPLTAIASATGTAALAEIRDNSGATVVSGLTVGAGGTDIIVSSTSVTSGQTITVTSGTITHG